MHKLQKAFYFVFAMVFVCVIGCSAVKPAPVDHLPQPPTKKITTHTVGKGETLFSIAWSYGLDFRSLAKANGIDASYTIHPGQVLNLLTRQPVTVERVVRNPPSLSRSRSSSASSPISKPQSKPVSKPAYSKPVVPQVKSMGNGKVHWRWPVYGKIIKRYSASGAKNKGIDIAGTLGEPVKAAADGTVVYAGSGLLGYGKLIIIKHNDRFLSAYAHNRKLLVQEGQSVKGGGTIAEMGASGAERVKLHFEIRRDGKPTDPGRYLPPR